MGFTTIFITLGTVITSKKANNWRTFLHGRSLAIKLTDSYSKIDLQSDG